MNLETFFNDEDIKDIYTAITIYSIKKYQTLPIAWQDKFQKRYQNAINNLNQLNISSKKLNEETIESLYVKLETYQKLYFQIAQLNQLVIQQYIPLIESKIIETIKKYPTDIEKVTFLFTFLTEYLTYSEDCFKYCLQVPPIDNFVFDFKYNLPVQFNKIEEMLIMNQGICDDISNLLIYLGNKLNLNIKKIFANYKDNNHSLNKIIIENQIFLIDATRKIRKDKTTNECFLVSPKTLNKEGYYIFENLNEQEEIQDYNKELPNYQDEVKQLIKELKTLLPTTELLITSETSTLKK